MSGDFLDLADLVDLDAFEDIASHRLVDGARHGFRHGLAQRIDRRATDVRSRRDVVGMDRHEQGGVVLACELAALVEIDELVGIRAS